MCLLAILVDCSGRALRLKSTESAWLRRVCLSVIGLCPLMERGQDAPALQSCAWPSRVDAVWRTLEVTCVCAVLPVVAGRASCSPLQRPSHRRDGGFTFTGRRAFQAENVPSCL